MRLEPEDLSAKGPLGIEHGITEIKPSIPERDTDLGFRQKFAVEICNPLCHASMSLLNPGLV